MKLNRIFTGCHGRAHAPARAAPIRSLRLGPRARDKVEKKHRPPRSETRITWFGLVVIKFLLYIARPPCWFFDFVRQCRA